MATLTMTRGLPGSGKTTWAKSQPAAHRINKDDLRAMLHNGVHSKANEREVLEVRDMMVVHFLSKGESVIVDDTNFNPAHETTLRALAAASGAIFDIKDFSLTPLATCLERNRNRKDKEPVPERVIRRMYEQSIKPSFPLPTYDPMLPHVVIVDVDGTLAHRQPGPDGSIRSPFDWHRVGEDQVDTRVMDYLAGLIEHTSVKIIFLSGRDEVCRRETTEWLHRFFDPSEVTLLMRSKDDNRKDAVIKRELFETHIKDKYYPWLVLDDRNQVVDMWREDLGLTVWQVAPGDF